ncbi:MAG: glycosyltransferase, partial [Parvularculaceae bacterium]|nr:glycosyltransferase [Parvularculaceae bacterium]
KPDFIEGSSPWRGGWVAARQPRRIPRALVFHQDPVLSYPHVVLRNRVAPDTIDRSFRWFFRYMTKLQSHYDLSVVSSSWLAERLAQHGLERPTVVPFGIDRRLFANATPSAYLRRAMLAECGVDNPNATLFFSASRLHPEKRVPMMLEAFRKASRAAPMALYHVGDGPYRERVAAVAATVPGARIAGIIRDREQIATMYASADCYLHACPNETFGMTVAESMAAGAVVVAPAAGAVCDLMDPSFALSFAADDIDAMAEAMLRFTRTDAAWRASARAASRAKSPSIENHFANLFALYERHLEARRSDRVLDQRRIRDRAPRLEKVA